MSAIEIIPTIVPAAFSDIQAVSERYANFTSLLQIDVADGKFAPNTTWLPRENHILPSEYRYEVHLMVSDPLGIGTVFAQAGARRIIVHVETLHDVESAKNVFTDWKRYGVESVGLAILLHTPIEKAEPYLSLVDYVLLMTIPRIGVQGIPYDPSAPARVAEFHERCPDMRVAVDGGVSEATIEELARAGARSFGVGSAIAKAPDPAVAYRNLKTLAEKATL